MFTTNGSYSRIELRLLLALLLFAGFRVSMQLPLNLIPSTVYPFAPVFVSQPTDVNDELALQRTAYGTYAFAYLYNSQTQINSVTLPCLALSNPAPKYQWMINGTFIQSNDQYKFAPDGPGNLTISPLSAGMYQCVVTSGTSIAFSNIVNLTATYILISSASDSRTETVTLGSYYVLPREAVKYSSFPRPVVTWRRDSQSSSSADERKLDFNDRVIRDELDRVHITFVKQEDCCSPSWLPYYRVRFQMHLTNIQLTPFVLKLDVPQNPLPNFQPIKLQYLTPSPLTVVAGETVRIVCVYSGSSPIVVSYSKMENGTAVSVPSIPGEQNTLYITSAKLTDSGTYQCQAVQTSASDGTSTTPAETITLNVVSPPQWINMPTDVFVPVGDQVSIRCVATGNPVVTTAWSVNGVAASSGGEDYMLNETSFTVLNAQKPRSNRAVQCIAYNSFGTLSANAAVTVIDATQITSKPGIFLQQQSEAVVSFACEAVGDPLLRLSISWSWTDIYDVVHSVAAAPPGIQISFGQNDSTAQQTLTIDTSQFDDKNLVRGSYTCIATNGWSTATATGRLSFHGDADGLVVSGGFYWWIAVAILAVVLLLLIILIIACRIRNRGGTYAVDQKERAQGRNPTDDLKKMHAFTEYVRPDSQPTMGSRAGTVDRLPPPYAAESVSQPTSEIGEDGSFRGAYVPGNMLSPPSSPFAAANQAYQPSFDERSRPMSPRRAPPPLPLPLPSNQPYSAPNRFVFDNYPGYDNLATGISDSVM